MTIHRIGKNPNAAPSVPASRVCPIGMPYTSTATTMATAREISDATHAVTLRTPRRMNSSSRGIAATSELHAREWATGSRTCWYTSDLDVRFVACVTTGTQPAPRLNGRVLRRGLRVDGGRAVQVAKRGQPEGDEAEQQHRQRQGQERRRAVRPHRPAGRRARARAGPRRRPATPSPRPRVRAGAAGARVCMT